MNNEMCEDDLNGVRDWLAGGGIELREDGRLDHCGQRMVVAWRDPTEKGDITVCESCGQTIFTTED
jgi:hypothetical protein